MALRHKNQEVDTPRVECALIPTGTPLVSLYACWIASTTQWDSPAWDTTPLRVDGDFQASRSSCRHLSTSGAEHVTASIWLVALLTYAAAMVLTVLTRTRCPCSLSRKCQRARWIALSSKTLICWPCPRTPQFPLVPLPSWRAPQPLRGASRISPADARMDLACCLSSCSLAPSTTWGPHTISWWPAQ